jgi:Periplasmic binding protein
MRDARPVAVRRPSRRSTARPFLSVGVPIAVAFTLMLGLASCGNSGDEASPSGSNVSSNSDVTQAGGPNESPGVTDSEIKFASFGTNSANPLGTCVLDCFDAGVKAYFAWRNDEGGVHGRKLVLSEELDDQLMQNQQRALEIVSANDVFAAFSAAQVANGWKELATAGIPLYTWAINFNEMNGNPGIYGNAAVTCAGCTSPFIPWVAKQANAKKVASLGYGISQNSKDCANGNKQSVEKYAKDTGQSAAYTNDNLDFGLPNGIGPEVTAMKDAGVDFVATCLDLNGVKTLETEMGRQGMGSVPVLHANTYDVAYVSSAGDLFEGDFVGTSFRPFEADAGTSQVGKFHEWMQKTGAKETELAMNGWMNADLAYQGIKAAGPSFTRESVIAATNKMTDWNAGGMTAPIDWSRQHEFPTEADPVTHGPKLNCRSFVRVKSQKFELVGQKDKPFVCFDPKNSAWTDPTMENFG